MDDNTVNIGNLDMMLRKFFAGETSCAQDRAIADFFCSEAHIPAEYECYREMFGWYSSGMNEDNLPSEDDMPVQSKPCPHRRTWLWWSSAAAILAVPLITGWSNHQQQMTYTPMYTESYVTRDGKTIEGEDEICGDIEASIMDAYCLEQEIDLKMNMFSKN